MTRAPRLVGASAPAAAVSAEPAVRATHLTDAAGDGFDALFERERVPMVRLAYLLVRSEPLAEEVVQDAFAIVYLRWDRIDRPGAFLRRTVVNGAKRTLRRRALEARHATTSAEPTVEPEGRDLLDALAALPHRQRAVVVLRFYERMTQEEIAEALDLRLGTVKSSLHRGLARLREVIDP